MTTLIRTKLTILGLLAATAISGCGTDPISRVVDSADEIADRVCICPAVVDQPSEAACVEALTKSAPSPSEEACMRRLYDAYSAELDPVLDCQYAAGRAMVDCLEPLLTTCPPPPAADDCLETFEATFEACPRPSAQAQAELAACFASRS